MLKESNNGAGEQNLHNGLNKIVHSDAYWEEQAKRLFPNFREKAKNSGLINIVRRLLKKQSSIFQYQIADFGSAAIAVPMDVKYYSFSQDYYSSRQKRSETFEDVEVTRKLLAKMMNTSSENLFFSYNTTESMKIALDTLPIPEISEVITTNEEYGSIMRVLAHKSSILRKVEIDDSLIENLNSMISRETSVVVLSYVTHDTCKILPVREISEMIKAENIKRTSSGEKRIYLVIDAAQALGHVPVDFEKINADALVGCGHKWLRGDTTSGFLYLSDIIKPKLSLFSSSYQIPPTLRNTLKNGAGLEEHTTDNQGFGNSIKIAHLGQCLQEYENLGWESVFQRINYLGENARAILSTNPEIQIVDSYVPAPGMIPFRFIEGSREKPYQTGQTISGHAKASFDQEKFEELLIARGVRVTYKKNLSWNCENGTLTWKHHQEKDILRISVSPFNTLEEIHALDGAITDIARTLTR